ncbi:hypothetical protein INT47_004292 [Mucor saturninus]|uniref:Uncharacterized protein n=1 Tax=Mucor saturninus TaxID=64648 RepID=A0A8H7RAT8_9FUNG|nr:hypothetical protein INT47_004292 [Mucor saturninus]
MNHKFILSTLLTSFVYQITASLVVVECTFPCSQGEQYVCEVTDKNVRCKNKTNKTKWILENTISLPQYQGTLSALGQSCTIAPQPKLKDGSHSSINASESIMEWPPQVDMSNYDTYYSNCEESLYCDKAHICVKQYTHGQVCESDNQCFQGSCQNDTCVASTIKKNTGGLDTIHIILTVVGVVLFVALCVGVYILKRRRKLQQQQQQKKAAKVIVLNSRSNSTNSMTSSVHHTVTNILQPDYESTFSAPHSPSRQQQELQAQLQRQYEGQLKVPPPPYSP